MGVREGSESASETAGDVQRKHCGRCHEACESWAPGATESHERHPGNSGFPNCSRTRQQGLPGLPDHAPLAGQLPLRAMAWSGGEGGAIRRQGVFPGPGASRREGAFRGIFAYSRGAVRTGPGVQRDRLPHPARPDRRRDRQPPEPPGAPPRPEPHRRRSSLWPEPHMPVAGRRGLSCELGASLAMPVATPRRKTHGDTVSCQDEAIADRGRPGHRPPGGAPRLQGIRGHGRVPDGTTPIRAPPSPPWPGPCRAGKLPAWASVIAQRTAHASSEGARGQRARSVM